MMSGGAGNDSGMARDDVGSPGTQTGAAGSPDRSPTIRPTPVTYAAPQLPENRARRRRAEGSSRLTRRLLRDAPVVVATAAIAYGIILRAWLLAHLPLFGDEAVVGLMTRQINAGHFTAFYWGQRYGGVEPYLAAVLQRLGGDGPTALNLTAALLSAVAAGLVVAIVRTAGVDRRLALLAGAVAWVWPYVVVWNSVRELGFRYAALCCGLTALLCAVRAQQRKDGPITFGLLGLALGVGWWASPEILYFLVPCLVLLAGWWRSAGAHSSGTVEPEGPRALGRGSAMALAAAGALLGSLPWWYANLGSGFASLNKSALPAGGGLAYGARLSVFFHKTLPMDLGVRTAPGGAWTGGAAIGHLLFVLVLAAVLAGIVRAVWVIRGGSHRLAPLALAVGVVTFPFLCATVSATSYWVDGRYGLYVSFMIVPLLALTLAGRDRRSDATTAGPPGSTGRPGRVRVRMGALFGAGLGVLGATLLTIGASHAGGVPNVPKTFFSSWRDPNAPMRQVVDAMTAHHLTYAFGDYWTAYDLEFIGDGRVTVSPSALDVDRWPALSAKVAASSDPAWLFFAPAKIVAASGAFSNPQPGPGDYTEQTFEARLTQLSIRYRVVHLGVLDAVVPSRRVVIP